MTRFMNQFVILLALVLLPLQTVSAAVVPLCDQAAQGAAVQSPGHDHHHVQGGHSGQQPVSDECGACYQCCAPAIPVITGTLMLPAPSVYQASLAFHFSRFVPEQPQRPPLA